MKSNVKQSDGVDVIVELPNPINQLDDQAKQEITSIISRAKQDVRRALKRAEQQEGYERLEIVQAKGPTIEAWARLLCSDEFEIRGREPLRIALELFQTAGGAWIAVTTSTPTDRDGLDVVRATVVERQDDEAAMRFAVMDAFDWHMRARSMVTKKLRWSLRKDVA
ncbi:hypothetical protein [Novosphingobium sp.]|uniref:hypothetical protein n=1 Tax=Novosphingobium sp. TaxID=1874826 RepID=UPI002FDC82C1